MFIGAIDENEDGKGYKEKGEVNAVYVDCYAQYGEEDVITIIEVMVSFSDFMNDEYIAKLYSNYEDEAVDCGNKIYE